MQGEYCDYELVDLVKSICEKKYSVIDVSDRTRRQRVCNVRHVAIFVCHKITEFSLGELGDLFDKRDHTTIMNSIRAVERSPQLTTMAINVMGLVSHETTGNPQEAA